MKISQLLIKQAVFVPILFFIPTTIAGFLVEGYSFVGQHGSEITITDNQIAKTLVNLGAILSGLSCILLELAMSITYKKFYFTAILIAMWGWSMISNGLVPMGSPMHGIYGMGAVLMITPFIGCYEFKNHLKNPLFFKLSLVSGVLIFIYLWSIFVRLDPMNFRGLTQRITSGIIFGWIAYFGYNLLRINRINN